MGADLMLIYAPVPRLEGEEVTVIWDRAGTDLTLTPRGAVIRQEVQARIAALSDEQIDAAVADCTGGDVDDLGVTDIREYLLKCFDDVSLGGRDVSVMQVEGRKFYFTGGMSWGDDPTDSFQQVGLLYYTDLLDAPFGLPTRDSVRVLVALDVPAHFADDPTMTECIVARLADEAGYLQDGAVPITPTSVVAVCIEDDTPLDSQTLNNAYVVGIEGAR